MLKTKGKSLRLKSRDKGCKIQWINNILQAQDIYKNYKDETGEGSDLMKDKDLKIKILFENEVRNWKRIRVVLLIQ